MPSKRDMSLESDMIGIIGGCRRVEGLGLGESLDGRLSRGAARKISNVLATASLAG